MGDLRCAVLCLLAAAPAQATGLNGQWCGVAEQTNPDGQKSHWSARLLLSGAEGHMEYPSLDCGGTLAFERSEGSVHFYRERITFGRDHCIDDGLVSVEQVAESVRWTWSGSDIKAMATLGPNCLDGPRNARLEERRRRHPAG